MNEKKNERGSGWRRNIREDCASGKQIHKILVVLVKRIDIVK